MSKQTKKIFAWVMTFAMLLSLLLAAGLTALAAEEGVTYRVPTYVDNDPSKGIDHWETKTTDEYTAISESNKPTTWDKEWYVVTETVSIEGSVTVSGNVNLILADGAKLTINNGNRFNKAGIRVSGESNSLTIYGQSKGTGKLEVTGGRYGAGIGGGDNDKSGSNITINGGSVTANGGGCAAGIGGGNGESGKNITINGGEVTATGDSGGVGIGGGSQGSGSNITINGGSVTATGSNGGAGIGGGMYRNGSEITINGGSVTATGSNGGAGIGGGWYSSGSKIYVATTLCTLAGSSASPKDLIPNNGGDLAGSLANKQYAVVENHGGYTYTAGGNTITKCCAQGHDKGTITISAPENLYYDGTAKPAVVTNTTTDTTPAVVYYQNETEIESVPTEIGSYTAKITLGDVTASVSYEIASATAPTQSQSVTADKSAWEAGVTFRFQNKGDVTLDGSVRTAIDRIYGEETWSGLSGPILITFQFSNIPSGEVFEEVIVGQ